MYTVTLTTTDAHNVVRAVSNQVTVTGIADPGPQYSGSTPPWIYSIDPVVPAPPAPLSGTSAPDYLYPITSLLSVKLAVGDMTHDGVPEVAVAVNNSGSAIDTHVFSRQKGDGSFGRSTRRNPGDAGVTSMEMLFSDFDGDSLRGVLSSAAGDCRQVSDLSVISLTWEPPFFSAPQASSYASAVYGRTVSSSTSTDTESETAFSNSFTIGVGVSVEVDEPIVAIKTLEIDAKATLGAEFQHATGETHGDEISYTTDKSFPLAMAPELHRRKRWLRQKRMDQPAIRTTWSFLRESSCREAQCGCRSNG